MNKTNEQEYLDEVTKVGKEITINIKILDAEKAKQLLGTMYGKNVDEFGVEVQSWGFWDVTKANKLKQEAIEKEIQEHSERIQSLLYKSDLDYLSEEEV